MRQLQHIRYEFESESIVKSVILLPDHQLERCSANWLALH